MNISAVRRAFREHDVNGKAMTDFLRKSETKKLFAELETLYPSLKVCNVATVDGRVQKFYLLPVALSFVMFLVSKYGSVFAKYDWYCSMLSATATSTQTGVSELETANHALELNSALLAAKHDVSVQKVNSLTDALAESQRETEKLKMECEQKQQNVNDCKIMFADVCARVLKMETELTRLHEFEKSHKAQKPMAVIVDEVRQEQMKLRMQQDALEEQRMKLKAAEIEADLVIYKEIARLVASNTNKKRRSACVDSIGVVDAAEVLD